MENNNHYYAVILAGGGGTRLWPKSRKKLPKHLLNLFSKDTLLRLTYNRIVPIIPKERIFILTLGDYQKLVKGQIPELDSENILVEPMAKNTALAVGLAAARIHKIDPEAVIMNFPADQIIQDDKKFQQTILGALHYASTGDEIVAVGIRPTHPHTGLGYIRIGGQVGEEEIDGEKIFAFRSKGFKEKPDLVSAQTFLASKEYLWNAGLYCWSVQTLFNALEKHNPSISKSITEIIKVLGKKDELEDLIKIYENAEELSIDYAVSEKAKNIIVIPGNFVWSDVGDWKGVYDMHQKNEEGNVLVNDSIDFSSIDTKNCLIDVSGKLVVTIGLKDIMIVDTPDALLVCAKNKTQEVKKIVEKLKADKKTEYI